eukprot:TRINITY_DN2345_c0_g1_i1.p1 TRINITY_DN2345_c0_g1~~TRINITY_DN2345_c0_g1_i1.p1  ORF type:complete len:427 (-),score=66.21 TRINITY_DN2345_c0_g1_i1:426-1706(-)
MNKQSFYDKGVIALEDNLIVKVIWNGKDEIRRIKFTRSISWQLLVSQVGKTFKMEPHEIVLKYTDEDGDNVTISTDEELADLLRMQQQPVKLIRLILFTASPKGMRTNDSVALMRIPLGSPAADTLAAPMNPFTAPFVPSAPAYTPPIDIANDPYQQQFPRYPHYHHCGRGRGRGRGNRRGQWDHDRSQKEMLRAEKVLWKSQMRNWKKACKMEKKRNYKKKNLYARFVKHVSVPDGSTLAPNVTFVKTWRMRNEGSNSWKLGSKLLFVSRLRGDQMNAPEYVLIPTEVMPTQEIDISVTMRTPTAPGMYTSFWRLCTPEGKKFGQRVWCKICVASNDDPIITNHVTASPVEVKMDGDELPMPSPHMQASFMSTDEQPPNFATRLDTLSKMGFADTGLNVRLLKNYNGDVTAVALALTNGNYSNFQ